MEWLEVWSKPYITYSWGLWVANQEYQHGELVRSANEGALHSQSKLQWARPQDLFKILLRPLMAAFTGERIFIVIDKIHSYHIAILKYLGLWLSFLIILCLNLKKIRV